MTWPKPYATMISKNNCILQLDPQGRDSLSWHQFRNKHYLLHYINITNNDADNIFPLKVALTAV